MVLGGDSCSEGHGFESRRRILDGCNIFSHICCKNCNVSLGGTKINEKRPGMAHLKTRYVVKRLMGPGPE